MTEQGRWAEKVIQPQESGRNWGLKEEHWAGQDEEAGW